MVISETNSDLGPVTHAVSQGSILGQVSFNIFIGYLDDEADFTLCHNSEKGLVVNRPEDHAARRGASTGWINGSLKTSWSSTKGSAESNPQGGPTPHTYWGPSSWKAALQNSKNCRILFFFFLHFPRYGEEDALDSLKGSMTGHDHYKEIVIGISRKKNQLIYETTMKKSHSSFPHKTKPSQSLQKNF